MKELVGNWEKVSNRMGTAPGGIYKEEDGSQIYVKFPFGKGQARAEMVADLVYEELGVRTLRHEVLKVVGGEASVSDWLDGLCILRKYRSRRLSEEQIKQAALIFMVSALVKNWDVVGLEHDNIAIDPDGNLYILDTGGSFTFRAMGEHKDFTPDVDVELGHFLDPYTTSGAVFAPLYERHPKVFVEASRLLQRLTLPDFWNLAGGYDEDPSEIVRVLRERRDRIVTYFQR